MSLRLTVKSLFVPVVLGLIGALMVFHPTLLRGFGAIQAHEGDARFTNYVLEHTWLWLHRAPHHDAFWNAPFFYPAANVTAFSETFLGAAPLYWIWRWLGAERDTAYQLWLLAIVLANFTSAFAFLRRGLRHPVLAAAAGAFLFAFAAVRSAQLFHPQLLPQFFSMTAILALAVLFTAPEEQVRSPRAARWVALFCVAAAGQVYASFYLGWFFAFCTALALLAGLAIGTVRQRMILILRAQWWSLLGGAVLAALLLLPLATHYLAAAQQTGFRAFASVVPLLPRPWSWLYVGDYSWLYGWMAGIRPFTDLPYEHEHRIGFGLVTPALCLLGLAWYRQRPGVRVLAGAALGLFLAVTLFPGDLTCWKWVFQFVPGANAVRAVVRIGAMMLIPAAVGLSLAVQRLRERGWLLRALPVLAFGLAEQVETQEAFDKSLARAEVHAVASRIGAGCDAFLFTPLRAREFPEKHQIVAMLASLDAGVPTINGYSGVYPPGWALADVNVRDAGQQAVLGERLAEWLRHAGYGGRVCTVAFAPADKPGATASASAVPERMVAGGRYPVTIHMRNTGATTWTPREGYRLALTEEAMREGWSGTPSAPHFAVLPGEEAAFSFTVTAPSEPDRHALRCQMRENVSGPFGAIQTILVAVDPADVSKVGRTP